MDSIRASPLITLPKEIIALILLDLDRTDLVTIALTCRKLSQVVTQDQISYSYVCAEMTRSGLWRHLAANPSLARHVKHLELCHETDDEILTNSAVVQRIMAAGGSSTGRFEDAGKLFEAVKDLLEAISHMRNLKRFRWLLCGIIPDIFMAVAKICTGLEELVVYDTGADYRQKKLDHLRLFSPFQKLEHFWYQSPSGNSARLSPHRASALYELLHTRCPTIRDLHVDLRSELEPDDEQLQKLFQAACWPHLERLSVSADLFEEHYKRFFQAHPSLISLRISEIDTEEHSFNELPSKHLRCFEMDTSRSPPGPGIRFFTGSAVDTIEEFSFIQMRGHHELLEGTVEEYTETHHFLCDFLFLPTLSNLQQIIIISATHSQSSFATLLGLVPLSIETLVYYPMKSNKFYAEGETDHWLCADISRLLQPIARFPRLTHLGIIKVDLSNSDDEKLESLVAPVFERSPSLQYLGTTTPIKSGIFWCRAERTIDGTYSACKVLGQPRKIWGAFSDIREFGHSYHFDEYWPKVK